MSFPTIPVLPVGTTGLKASRLGYGCMGLHMGYVDAQNPVTEEASRAVLDRTIELGCTFLDTSDRYGPHTNETFLGKALKGRRNKVVIASKFGLQVCGTPEYVRSACEASLQRLQTSHIDLYYQHRVDRTIPIEDTWRAMKQLVEEGKVRHLGISEASAKEIERAHKIHPIAACQLEWSLWSRQAEDEVIPTCRRLGIAIVPFSPLGRGFLTGTITSQSQFGEKDMRANMPRFDKENFDKNLALVEEVRHLAAQKQCTPGQLALAWVLAQGDDVFPIPGTTKVHRLEENIRSLDVKLTKQDMDSLEAIFHKDKISGQRYGEAGMQQALHGGEQ